jgi:nitroreductase
VIVIPLADKSAYLRRYSEPDKKGLKMEAEEGWPVPYWELDAAMAAMAMLLSAVDEGLGGWFFGIFNGEEELRRHLRIPDRCRPIGALAFGYPDPDDRPGGSAVTRVRRGLDEIVHRGGFEPERQE